MRASTRAASPAPPASTRAALRRREPAVSYEVRPVGATPIAFGDGPPAFVIRVPSRAAWDRLVAANAYLAGLAFIRGDIDVDGDLVAAVRFWARQHRPRRIGDLPFRLAARLRPEHWAQSRGRARRNIEFHYDRSNEFYRAFLDRRMVYSCAYFEHPSQPLDEAQENKLDLVCRKLDLQPGERFLDVGCGWGALVTWATERYGARSLGCTLSRRQHEAGVRLLGERGLAGRARVELRDYREVRERFDKIASVGMVEHVGRRRLPAYFQTLAARLGDTGLLLNHGIIRPSGVREDATGRLLQQRVFPGGELASLETTIEAAERAGFEVLDVENLRPHYALTCRAWVSRLQANRTACLEAVDPPTYRTWLLYLAGSAVGFADGTTDVYQVLLAKRSPVQVRRLTRRYLYADWKRNG